MLIGIVGCGGLGREVMPYVQELRAQGLLERAGTEDRVVFVETQPSGVDEVDGFTVMSDQTFYADRDPDKRFNIAIADSRARERIADQFIAAGTRPLALHGRYANVSGLSEIGEGAVFCSGSIITSNATIGRFFLCMIFSYVAHDCIIGDFVTFAPRVCCNGNVTIEDHAYIGTGAMLRQGTRAKPLRIGQGAVIGMGAVVTKDVPAGETWIGNPARPLDRK